MKMNFGELESAANQKDKDNDQRVIAMATQQAAMKEQDEKKMYVQ